MINYEALQHIVTQMGFTFKYKEFRGDTFVSIGKTVKVGKFELPTQNTIVVQPEDTQDSMMLRIARSMSNLDKCKPVIIGG